MKPFIIGLAVLIAAATQAKQVRYQLDMNLSINGKVVTSPQMIVNPSQKASISTGEIGSTNQTFIEVTATAKKGNAVAMDFSVGTAEKGVRMVLARPRITTKIGEAATVSAVSADGDGYSLTVLPNQIDL